MFPKIALNKETQRMIVVAAMVAVVVYLAMERLAPKVSFMGCKSKYGSKSRMRAIERIRARRSGYALKPAAITTTAPAEEARGLDGLTYDMECTPGMEKGAYYTKSLTPGGFCGDQAAVNEAMHGYDITAGVGDTLLGQ